MMFLLKIIYLKKYKNMATAATIHRSQFVIFSFNAI